MVIDPLSAVVPVPDPLLPAGPGVSFCRDAISQAGISAMTTVFAVFPSVTVGVPASDRSSTQRSVCSLLPPVVGVLMRVQAPFTPSDMPVESVPPLQQHANTLPASTALLKASVVPLVAVRVCRETDGMVSYVIVMTVAPKSTVNVSDASTLIELP